MSDKPHFRFNPHAYENGGFVASDAECEACEKPSVWRYEGLIYAPGDSDPVVCARCIAAGKLEAIAAGYALHDMEFDEAPEDALAEEIEKRTPGFSTFNAFSWPVRGGEPLAFLGYGDDAQFKDNAAVSAAIAEAFADLGEDETSAPPYALVFKTLAGEDYVVMVDLD